MKEREMGRGGLKPLVCVPWLLPTSPEFRTHDNWLDLLFSASGSLILTPILGCSHFSNKVTFFVHTTRTRVFRVITCMRLWTHPQYLPRRPCDPNLHPPAGYKMSTPSIQFAPRLRSLSIISILFHQQAVWCPRQKAFSYARRVEHNSM
jgi:hypothetical protein